MYNKNTELAKHQSASSSNGSPSRSRSSLSRRYRAGKNTLGVLSSPLKQNIRQIKNEANVQPIQPKNLNANPGNGGEPPINQDNHSKNLLFSEGMIQLYRANDIDNRSQNEEHLQQEYSIFLSSRNVSANSSKNFSFNEHREKSYDSNRQENLGQQSEADSGVKFSNDDMSNSPLSNQAQKNLFSTKQMEFCEEMNKMRLSNIYAELKTCIKIFIFGELAKIAIVTDIHKQNASFRCCKLCKFCINARGIATMREKFDVYDYLVELYKCDNFKINMNFTEFYEVNAYRFSLLSENNRLFTSFDPFYNFQNNLGPDYELKVSIEDCNFKDIYISTAEFAELYVKSELAGIKWDKISCFESLSDTKLLIIDLRNQKKIIKNYIAGSHNIKLTSKDIIQSSDTLIPIFTPLILANNFYSTAKSIGMTINDHIVVYYDDCVDSYNITIVQALKLIFPDLMLKYLAGGVQMLMDKHRHMITPIVKS
ncbi:hypothetical protein BB561_001425 [Smittium simulii]|uniref:Rhodanese domain-containing protein n=1 Tax=Smittium simulii TaxID=133385 RepID=A0A2T9YUL6_9FUNG|nr:hypothetical protein BB561_001425 [Smittium simulii]